VSEATAEPVDAAPPSGAGSPGGMLRRAREARGLSVATVTEALLVDARVVDALESDRFGVFDAPVYARGFLRKYAVYLDVPAADVLAAYDALAGGPPVPTLIPVANAAPPPRDLRRVRLPAAVLAVVLLGAGSYWLWLGHGGRVAPAPAAPAPAPAPPAAADVAPPPAAAAPADAAPPLPQATVPSDDAVNAPLPETAVAAPTGSAIAVGAPAPTAAPAPAAATPVAEERAPPPARTAAGAALVINGIRDCWVEVRAPSGVRLLYDLVRAGDHRSVAGPGPWRVFLGNTDGVQLQVGEHLVTVPAAQRSGEKARFALDADGVVK
jgi:cytoskeleton protein RodZ